jgi:hypothetical protein
MQARRTANVQLRSMMVACLNFQIKLSILTGECDVARNYRCHALFAIAVRRVEGKTSSMQKVALCVALNSWFHSFLDVICATVGGISARPDWQVSWPHFP